ncbi:MAG: hypothetical protein V4596_03525 [Bdellovibrionota bacterium]
MATDNFCKVTPNPKGTISQTVCKVTFDEVLLATAELDSEIVCHIEGQTRGLSAYLMNNEIKIQVIKLDAQPTDVLNEVVLYKVIEMLGTFTTSYDAKASVQYSVMINKKRLNLKCLPSE